MSNEAEKKTAAATSAAMFAPSKYQSKQGICALPEGSWFRDATGVGYTKLSSGRHTENPNWIAWVNGDTKTHTDQIVFPIQDVVVYV